MVTNAIILIFVIASYILTEVNKKMLAKESVF
jgi:hypothetical protein